jgi:hypothetical protein
MQCDLCDRPATATISAAYPIAHPFKPDVVHPEFATYPSPLGRACSGHLVEVMHRDAMSPSASSAYLIKLIGT